MTVPYPKLVGWDEYLSCFENCFFYILGPWDLILLMIGMQFDFCWSQFSDKVYGAP